MNLGNQPVEILVEDVYLLVIPSPQTNTDPEEDEARAQAAKAERLENAELLHMRGQAESQTGKRSPLFLTCMVLISLRRIEPKPRTSAVID